MSPHLQFVRVTKSFGAKQVLNGVDLEVERGEALTLLGRSGSGKTVLLKLAIGLVAPDRGEIRVGGVNVAHAGPEPRRRMALLFQSGALFDSLTVGANVAYPLRVSGAYSLAEIEERVSSRLAIVGLPGTEALLPKDLSGGMQKRVALARAIAADPELILYDEPTMGLDPITRLHIHQLIRSVQERLGVTSLIVTHDLASALAFSDRLAMIADGKVLEPAPPSEFIASSHPMVREFVEAIPHFQSGARP